MAALEEACQMAVEERDFRVSLVSLFDLIDFKTVETPGDGHAGEVETSLMMVIRKDLVMGRPEKHFPIRPRFLIQKDVRYLMGNGIMGNPRPATIEKGKAFFEMAVRGSSGHWKSWSRFPRKSDYDLFFYFFMMPTIRMNFSRPLFSFRLTSFL